MAFCGRGVFIVFVLGLYLVHSDRSLIEESCKDWENDLGLDRFEDVDFDGEYSLTRLQCGKDVSLDRFTDQAPTVKYPKAESDKKYLVAMVDPDAPSKDNPTCRSWLHWIVSNINGDDLKEGNVENGDTLADYNPPTPPQGSGPHRYYLFVFEQEHELDSKVTKRCHLSIDDYKEKNGLKAVAMNMFKTENK